MAFRDSFARHRDLLQPGGATLFPELHRKHRLRNRIRSKRAWVKYHLLCGLSNGTGRAAGNCLFHRRLIIAWNKSDDWLALLVAFTLIGQGANAFGPLQRMAAIPSFEIPVRL